MMEPEPGQSHSLEVSSQAMIGLLVTSSEEFDLER